MVSNIIAMKKVIDGENMCILEYFHEDETDMMLKKYQNLGKWSDISVDRDGDIILWID